MVMMPGLVVARFAVIGGFYCWVGFHLSWLFVSFPCLGLGNYLCCFGLLLIDILLCLLTFLILCACF